MGLATVPCFTLAAVAEHSTSTSRQLCWEPSPMLSVWAVGIAELVGKVVLMFAKARPSGTLTVLSVAIWAGVAVSSRQALTSNWRLRWRLSSLTTAAMPLSAAALASRLWLW
jgi:hypothetical protein